MRGPNGKGHAQVAITPIPESKNDKDHFQDENKSSWIQRMTQALSIKVPSKVEENVNDDTLSKKETTSSGSSSPSLTTCSSVSIKPKSSDLSVRLTFVNTHWTCILEDLIQIGGRIR